MSFRCTIAYYVAFGPHGPRAPTGQPGDGLKIFLSTVGLVGVAGAMFFGIKAICASSCSCLLLFKRINAFSFFSTGPTKDYDQGMAGSLKRARKGVEAQSYHWYASFSVDLLNASPSPDLCPPSFEQSAGFMITEYFRYFFCGRVYD